MNLLALNTKSKLWMAISGALLLWIAWPPIPLAFLLFIGFVPLLLIEHSIAEDGDGMKKWRLFKWSFLYFFIFNSLTTWWVLLATIPGGVMAILGNSILLSVPIIFYHLGRKYLGKSGGLISWIIFYISFEFFHLTWQGSWPWLTLGNGFAQFPWAVQWYSITGALGGSLWILLVNYLIFVQIIKWQAYRHIAKDVLHAKSENVKNVALRIAALKPLTVILLPIIISIIQFYFTNPNDSDLQHSNVVVLQTNIDPYTENFYDNREQFKNLESFISQSEKEIQDMTDYLVWPETAFETFVQKTQPWSSPAMRAIRDMLERHPNMQLIAGVSAIEKYEGRSKPTVTSRNANDLYWFDLYNAAFQFQHEGDSLQWYHKSKLVPGAERIPYFSYLQFLNSFAENVIGTGMGNYATKDYINIFYGKDSIDVMPAICYESVYGDFVRKHVKMGADIIFVITNDGWWGKTAGRKQHYHYAKLRAIENRRVVARAANTGISCIINIRGEVEQRAKVGEATALQASIPVFTRITFYTRFGDYIGRLAAAFSIALILMIFVRARTRRMNKVIG